MLIALHHLPVYQQLLLTTVNTQCIRNCLSITYKKSLHKGAQVEGSVLHNCVKWQ